MIFVTKIGLKNKLWLAFVQISDAKITITDPKPGTPETLIIISGTPEQTHAAQSLIQAFVMLENESQHWKASGMIFSDGRISSHFFVVCKI